MSIPTIVPRRAEAQQGIKQGLGGRTFHIHRLSWISRIHTQSCLYACFVEASVCTQAFISDLLWQPLIVKGTFQMSTTLLGTANGSETHRSSMERECYSMADLANGGQVRRLLATTCESRVAHGASVPIYRNCRSERAPRSTPRSRRWRDELKRHTLASSRITYSLRYLSNHSEVNVAVKCFFLLNNQLFKANEHYHINGPGKAVRGSKEKMVYLRERKALKTIGIVVMGKSKTQKLKKWLSLLSSPYFNNLSFRNTMIMIQVLLFVGCRSSYCIWLKCLRRPWALLVPSN